MKSPADLKGLKIRTMQNPIHLDAFKALGANPTPMPFSEVFTAMQQKTIDGQENPIPTIYLSKFYEVQKFVSLTGHVYGPHILLLNKKLFDSFPADDQKVILEAAKESAKFQRATNRKMNSEQVAKLKEAGMIVTELSPAQKKAFQDACASVYATWEPKIGKALVDEVKATVAAGKLNEGRFRGRKPRCIGEVIFVLAGRPRAAPPAFSAAGKGILPTSRPGECLYKEFCMRLTNKTALVTGGAQGLGAEIARTYAAEGALVFIGDLKAEEGAKTVAEIEQKGGKALFVPLNVTDEESWKAAFAFVMAKAGKIDILVNNAGINIREPIEEMKVENLDTMLAVNVKGPFLGIKHVIPLMRKNGGGGASSTCHRSAESLAINTRPKPTP